MGAHSHGTPPAGVALPHRVLRPLAIALIAAAVITVVAMIWLWPGDTKKWSQESGDQERVNGTISAIHKTSCPEPVPGEPAPAQLTGVNGCGTATVKLTSGPDDGKEVVTQLPTGPGAPKVGDDDEVVLVYTKGAMVDQQQYSIVDHQRGKSLWILGAAFALAVIAFGRWRGLTALMGLVLTFAVLLLFIVPAILAGESPLLVAIVGSAAIMLAVLFLTHGFTAPTSIAAAGTLLSLALTGGLAALATAGTHLSGVADESSMYLGMLSGVDMRGLLLAGILIGSLGVLDDVTVTQAATVTELAHANPSYGFRQLYRAATRVGRAHIASVINTIILAYAGASLPLLLLIAAGDQQLNEVLTNQLIASELVRSIVSTLGLIAAVPITTALAAMVASHASAGSAEVPQPRRRLSGQRADRDEALAGQLPPQYRGNTETFESARGIGPAS